MRPQADFIDEFVPGASNQTLLLLRRIGGNERDLIGGELDLYLYPFGSVRAMEDPSISICWALMGRALAPFNAS